MKMNDDKEIKQFLNFYKKGKNSKCKKILKKRKDDIGFFDLLLKEDKFIECLGRDIMIDVIQTLNIEIQKKIILKNIYLFGNVSEKNRNDKQFIQGLVDDLYKKTSIQSLDDVQEEIRFVYENLGYDLMCDKNYIMSIKDISPETFIKSMRTIDYSVNELKEFFNKYYTYTSFIPDVLKSDYEYVVSLIEKNTKNSMDAFLGFGLDYLEIPQIKNAIIKTKGNDVYERIINVVLHNDLKKLNDLPRERFIELVLDKPLFFINQSLNFASFFDKKKRDKYQIINRTAEIASLTFDKINTPEKFSKILYRFSKTIKNGLTYSQINNQVVKHWDEIQEWIIQIDDKTSKIVINMPSVGVYNTIYTLLVGIQENKLDDIFQIFISSESRSSKHGKNIKNIIVTEENVEFLRFICDSYIFDYSNEYLNIFNQIYLLFKKYENSFVAMALIKKMAEDPGMANMLINVNIADLDENIIKNLYVYLNSNIIEYKKIDNIDELRNLNLLIDNLCNELDCNLYSRKLEVKKDLFLLQHFQIDLNFSKDIVHSYLGASEMSKLYQENPEVNYLKQLLERIVLVNDEKEFEILTKEYNNIKISFQDILKVISKIKNNYGTEIASTLTKVEKKVGVFDYSEKDFNFLVHVIGAYGLTPAGDVYDSWNTKDYTSSISICASYISQNNMGIAPEGENSVILGFSELPADYLQLMSCNDLYSKGFSALRESSFLTSGELRDNTRHGHNELVIQRRTGEYTQSKLQPSYIICFDKINEESRVASEKFGVPIIYIDREKVTKKERNKIDIMVQEFIETMNPSLISKIICEQENNRAGLRLVRPDLVDKYFNATYRQENIKKMYSVIKKRFVSNDSKVFLAMQEFIKCIEQEKEKFKVTEETPKRKNEFDLSIDEYIDEFNKNMIGVEKKEPLNDLSIEEVFNKFLECRKKLSQRESEQLTDIYYYDNKKGVKK